MALFLEGNENENQKGVTSATCDLTSGTLLPAQPTAPLGHSCCPHSSLPASHPPAKSPAEGVPRSHLFAEDLLALGIVDPRCPAPVSKALSVAII